MCVMFSDLMEISSSTKRSRNYPRQEHKPIDTSKQTTLHYTFLTKGIKHSLSINHIKSTPVVTTTSYTSINTMEGHINVTYISDSVERTYHSSIYNIQSRHITTTSITKTIRYLETNATTTTNTSSIEKHISTIQTPSSFKTIDNTSLISDECIIFTTLSNISHEYITLTTFNVHVTPTANTTILYLETCSRNLTPYSSNSTTNVSSNNATIPNKTDISGLKAHDIEVRNSTMTKIMSTLEDTTTTTTQFCSKRVSEYNSSANIVYYETISTIRNTVGQFMFNESSKSESNTTFERRNKVTFLETTYNMPKPPVPSYIQQPTPRISKPMNTTLSSEQPERNESWKIENESTTLPDPSEAKCVRFLCVCIDC